MAVFAKFDGIDGESKDEKHDKWIDVLNVNYGFMRPGGGATGQSRRRGAAEVSDLVLMFEYEKAFPKLQEKCLKGEVIPSLKIEQTATYGGSRAVYLAYELKKVSLTDIRASASGNDESGPPTCTAACNYEEIKVTYSEYDDDGSKGGNVETTWKVEKGTK